MKRILIAWLIASSIGLAETYVLPTRTDLNLVQPNYSLPFDTYTNTTTWLTGQLNGDVMTDFSPERTDAVIQSPCAVFNGAGGDYVAKTNVTSLSTLTNGAFCFWIKPTLGAIMYAGSLTSTAGDNDYISALRITDAGLVTFRGVFNASITALSSSVTLSNGVWAHIVMQSTGSAYELYVNGVKETLTATSGADDGRWSSSFANDANAISAGALLRTSAGSYFNGQLFGFAVYSEPLTQTQVMAAYSGSCPTDNVILEWVAAESSGTTIYDVSGNGNHGTATIASSEAQFWGGTQTNSPYAAQYGCSHYGNIARNGAFASTNDWILGAGWSVVSNKAVLSSGAAALEQSYASPPLINGQTYRLTLTIARTNATGAFYISSGGFGGASIPFGHTGTFTKYIVCADKTKKLRLISPDGWRGTVENLSLVHMNYIPALLNGTADALGNPINNPKGLAHNNGGYSLIFGGTTNTYANLLTNSVNIATNAAGLITEVWE